MRVQRVAAPDGGPESWTVVDETFAAVDPVDAFLAHLTVIERSPGTVRSYAFDLRDYFEFLTAHGIDWRTVRLEHLGRFVGWLRLAPATRTAAVTALVIDEPHCSAVTITRPAPTDRTGASDESWQRRIELAHQRIKQLSEENRQLRDQLAIAHGQRRADQITASKTPSMTQAPRS